MKESLGKRNRKFQTLTYRFTLEKECNSCDIELSEESLLWFYRALENSFDKVRRKYSRKEGPHKIRMDLSFQNLKMNFITSTAQDIFDRSTKSLLGKLSLIILYLY